MLVFRLVSKVLTMPPATRQKAKALRWENLRLPAEVFDTIMTLILDEVIHDVFYCASNLGVKMHEFPSIWIPVMARSSQKVALNTRREYSREFNTLTVFWPVLRLAQTCHQYRSAVEAILGRISPNEIPCPNNTSSLTLELVRIKSRCPDPHPLQGGSEKTFSDIHPKNNIGGWWNRPPLPSPSSLGDIVLLYRLYKVQNS